MRGSLPVPSGQAPICGPADPQSANPVTWVGLASTLEFGRTQSVEVTLFGGSVFVHVMSEGEVILHWGGLQSSAWGPCDKRRQTESGEGRMEMKSGTEVTPSSAGRCQGGGQAPQVEEAGCRCPTSPRGTSPPCPDRRPAAPRALRADASAVPGSPACAGSYGHPGAIAL